MEDQKEKVIGINNIEGDALGIGISGNGNILNREVNYNINGPVLILQTTMDEYKEAFFKEKIAKFKERFDSTLLGWVGEESYFSQLW